MIEVEAIEYTTFCHATEDCNKVVTALKNLIPPDLRSRVKVRSQTLHGYYKNPIVTYSIKISGDRAEVENALKYLAIRLSDVDRAVIATTLDLRYDTRMNKLFIRFGKQDAYLNSIVVSDGDDIIKVIIAFKRSRGLDKVAEYLRSMELIK